IGKAFPVSIEVEMHQTMPSCVLRRRQECRTVHRPLVDAEGARDPAPERGLPGAERPAQPHDRARSKRASELLADPFRLGLRTSPKDHKLETIAAWPRGRTAPPRSSEGFVRRGSAASRF